MDREKEKVYPADKLRERGVRNGEAESHYAEDESMGTDGPEIEQASNNEDTMSSTFSNDSTDSKKRKSPKPSASTSTPKKAALDTSQSSEPKVDELEIVSSPGLSAGVENIQLNEPSSSQQQDERMEMDEQHSEQNTPSNVSPSSSKQQNKQILNQKIEIRYKHIETIYKLLTDPKQIEELKKNLESEDQNVQKNAKDILKILLINIHLLEHEAFDKNLRKKIETLLKDNFDTINTPEIYIDQDKYYNNQIPIANKKGLFNSDIEKKCLIISQIFNKNDSLANYMFKRLEYYFGNDQAREKYLSERVNYSNKKTILSFFSTPPNKLDPKSHMLWQKLNEKSLENDTKINSLKYFTDVSCLLSSQKYQDILDKSSLIKITPEMVIINKMEQYIGQGTEKITTLVEKSKKKNLKKITNWEKHATESIIKEKKIFLKMKLKIK